MEEIEINAESKRIAARFLPAGKWRLVEVDALNDEGMYTFTYVGTRTRFSAKVWE